MKKKKISKKTISVQFVKADFDFFEKECSFTEEQQQVFDCLKKDWSIDKISINLYFSTSKVSKLIKEIKNKILRVLESQYNAED